MTGGQPAQVSTLELSRYYCIYLPAFIRHMFHWHRSIRDIHQQAWINSWIYFHKSIYKKVLKLWQLSLFVSINIYVPWELENKNWTYPQRMRSGEKRRSVIECYLVWYLACSNSFVFWTIWLWSLADIQWSQFCGGCLSVCEDEKLWNKSTSRICFFKSSVK